MLQTIFLSAMCKAQGLIVLFNILMTTYVDEGKLWIQAGLIPV